MEKAEARKLQPYFIRAFFQQAFRQLGGEFSPREQGRYDIRNVPAIIRESATGTSQVAAAEM